MTRPDKRPAASVGGLLEAGVQVRVAVVIPTLNEEAGIGSVIDEVKAVLEGFESRAIVVDGHSSDATVKVAREHGASVVRQRVAGYGGALMTGFKAAVERWDPNIMVMLDGDGTYDPADIPRMIEPIVSGEAEFVMGNRFGGMEADSMTRLNRIGNRVISGLARRLLGLNVSDTQCGMRAFSADLIATFMGSADGMPFATEMLADAKEARVSIAEVPIRYRARVGEPKLSPLRDGARIVGLIGRLLRDYNPMLFFGLLSLFTVGGGLVLGSRVLGEYLSTGTVKQVPSAILSTALILLGIQFFSLGLVADMIKGMGKRRKQVWELGTRREPDL